MSRPAAKTPTIQIKVTVTRETLARLQVLADERQCSLSSVVRLIIWQALEQGAPMTTGHPTVAEQTPATVEPRTQASGYEMTDSLRDKAVRALLRAIVDNAACPDFAAACVHWASAVERLEAR